MFGPGGASSEVPPPVEKTLHAKIGRVLLENYFWPALTKAGMLSGKR